MELKILFKNTSYLITTKVVKFLVGTVRAKLIAIFLGTLGAGIYAQLMQVTQSISQFSLLSMNDGLVKQIAESEKWAETFNPKLATLIKSYIVIILVVLMVALALSFYFAKEITIYFFGNIKYYNYCILGLASIPILMINSVSFAVLQGFKQIKYIARSELIVIIINLMFFVPLIYIWGLSGTVVYISISFLTVLIINHYYAQKQILKRRNLTIKDIYHAKISKKVMKELFLFASVGLTAGAAIILSDTITRSIVVTHLGINKIGVYSPIITWAGLFTGFILPSIGTYLYPRFSEAKSDYEVIGVLNDSLRFVTLMMLPFLLMSIPIRFQIIKIFYSNEFTSAGNYLPWHFLGTLFYLWMYVFAVAMTPTGRIKIQGFMVIMMSILDIVVVYIFVNQFGLYGWMLKFIISPLIFLVFYIIFFHKAINFTFAKKNVLIMTYTLLSFILIMMIVIYFDLNFKINFIIGLGLIVFSFFFLSKSEKDFILNYLFNIRNRLWPDS